MRLKTKDFGPLKNLDIEIKPLTILIGKNNLGKSYATQLFYVMVSVLNDFQLRYRFLPFGEPFILRRLAFSPRESDVEELTRQIREKDLTDFEIVNSLTRSVLDVEAKNIEVLLKMWFDRVFGVRFNKLVNIHSGRSVIECELFQDLRFKTVITKRRIRVELSITKRKINKYVKKLSPILQDVRQKRKKKTYVEKLAYELQEGLLSPRNEIEFLGYDVRIRKTRPLIYYIPAGRAGLIESYDTVVEALFFHAAGTPSFGLSVPPLPGMAAQFYGVLRSLSGRKGPLSDTTSKIFKELLSGDISLRGLRLRKDQPAIRTRMLYRFRLGEKQSTIDLVHAASMIKELAPIYLIVQELVFPGQFLIIEEPESHLHPGAQFDLARILTRLTKTGVRVFLTTHSPVMLRKLSHFVREESNELIDHIDPNSAALYWIKEDKSGSSSQVLRISKYGTLDEIPTFDAVINELYEEEIALQKEES